MWRRELSHEEISKGKSGGRSAVDRSAKVQVVSYPPGKVRYNASVQGKGRRCDSRFTLEEKGGGGWRGMRWERMEGCMVCRLAAPWPAAAWIVLIFFFSLDACTHLWGFRLKAPRSFSPSVVLVLGG
jgi:hypothetical protein